MGTPEQPWSYGLFIPHDPRAVGVVRATIRSVLKAARLCCLVDSAELLVSELVTNAHRYSTTDAYVSMDWEPGEFLVTVWDHGPGTPAPRQPSPEDVGGHGLALVENCADEWGVRDYPNGKAVWFRLAAKEGEA